MSEIKKETLSFSYGEDFPKVLYETFKDIEANKGFKAAVEAVIEYTNIEKEYAVEILKNKLYIDINNSQMIITKKKPDYIITKENDQAIKEEIAKERAGITTDFKSGPLGWIDRAGNFYKCEYFGHYTAALLICDYKDIDKSGTAVDNRLLDMGFIKIGESGEKSKDRNIYFTGEKKKKLTIKQKRTLVKWAKDSGRRNNRHYKSIIEFNT